MVNTEGDMKHAESALQIVVLFVTVTNKIIHTPTNRKDFNAHHRLF